MKFLKLLLLLAGIALLAAILLSLDIWKILVILKNADRLLVGAAIVLTLGALIGKGIKWRQLLFGQKNKVSIVESTSIYLKGFFLSIITPGRIGDLVRAFYLKEKTGFIPSLASVLVDRALDIILLLAFTLVLLTAFFEATGLWVFNPLLAIFLFAASLIASAYSLQSRGRGFFRRMLFFVIPEKHRDKVKEGYSELILDIQGAKKHKKDVFFAILIGTVNWVLAILTADLIGTALGINQSLLFFGVAIFALALMDLIPLMGSRELGAIFLFSSVGVSAELAVAFSLATFVIGYILPAVVGGILFLRKPISF